MKIFTDALKQVATVLNADVLRQDLTAHGHVNSPHLIVSLFDVLRVGTRWMTKIQQASLFVADGIELRDGIERVLVCSMIRVLDFVRDALSPTESGVARPLLPWRMTIVLKADNVSHAELESLLSVSIL
jgi:hypothetical protein